MARKKKCKSQVSKVNIKTKQRLEKANKALKLKREKKKLSINLIDFSLPFKFRMNLCDLASKVFKILSNLKLRVCFAYGNLLGVVRSCPENHWNNYLSFIPYDDDIDLFCISEISEFLTVPWKQYNLVLTQNLPEAKLSLHYSGSRIEWPFIEFFSPRIKDLELIKSCSLTQFSLYPRPDRFLGIDFPHFEHAKKWLFQEYGNKCLFEAVIYKPHLDNLVLKDKKRFKYNTTKFDVQTGELLKSTE
jgi:hypothetical protein